jgi:tRNA (mo5U34)-methyltransferase
MITPDKTDKSATELREEIIRLGPWHLDVEVTPEISTRVSLEAEPGTYPGGQVSFLNGARERWQETLGRVYPQGLQERTMLDCACNCGGYVFWAKELGAGDCLGFDAREHWIKQARFLRKHRRGPSDGVRFEVCDLYGLPKMRLEPFDVTLFKGIFYHLPEPITGLKIAADLTNELMVVNTATRSGLPDGLLQVDEEDEDHLMSGVHGLCWLPTGPDVVTQILRWAGFVEAHLMWWSEEVPATPGLGRLQILASKVPGALDGVQRSADA